ncbi:MAG: cyclic nucleotide-binding domain-containing protein [Myxococcales bacterium]|nr:cyclic nucleotide-binding domain-containing protein [Myxococcota bacterium]MDW8281149.1 cyclic nucleotide-binding domain-containing protein [Myxococcales bacterium]
MIGRELPPQGVSAPRLGVLAAVVIFNVVVSTASQEALFLAHHRRDTIPPAMLLGSLLTAATSIAATQLLRRFSPARVLRLMLLGLGLLAAAFSARTARPTAEFSFAYFLFVELATTLSVAATWTYFQAPMEASVIRRLLPRLGVWAGAGGLLAGGLIPLVQQQTGSPQGLIPLSAGGWFLAALLVQGRHRPDCRRAYRRVVGLRQVLRLPLLRWLAVGACGIIWMGLLLQYETRVALQQHLTPPQIAHAMGFILASTSMVGIFVQGLLTTPILERWGVGLALAILPLSVSLLLGLYLVMPTLYLIAGAFVADKLLRPHLHRPAESCLLVAVPTHIRPALMMVLGSILQPMLKAVGALVLWAMAAGVHERWIAPCALALTSGMVALSTRWGRLYARTLQQTLEEGSVEIAEEVDEDKAMVPLIDGPRLKVLLGAIDNGSPRSRELALQMLRPHRSGLVQRAMLERLDSPVAAVRTAALRWFAVEPQSELAPQLRRRFAAAQLSLSERIALLEAAGPEAPSLLGANIADWLSVPQIDLRSAVIRALLVSADEAHRAQARQAIADLLHASDVEACVAGVRLVRELRDPSYLAEVLSACSRFAVDTEAHRRVRREVLECLPMLPGPQAHVPLWDSLADPQLAHVAVRGLAACGPAVLPQALAALADPTTPLLARHNLVRLLGQLPSRLSIPTLLGLLETPERGLRLEALKALGQLQGRELWSPTASQRQLIEHYILKELIYALPLRRCRDLLHRHRMPSSLVLRELQGQLDSAQQRVFRALRLLFPGNALLHIFNALRSPISPRHDPARELLRSLLPPGPMATGCLMLLDLELPWSEECHRPPLSVFTQRSPEAVLAWLAQTGDPWILAALRYDPGHEMNLPSTADMEDPMHASLDTLLFLKDVALFEALTNQQLVEVAKLAERIQVPAGHILFHQNDPPDYLYLVKTGKLAVKVSGVEVARLGPGECAGEMAVLSGTERTATVEAVEPSTLLRFEADHFLQLLETYPEIGRGLLRSLVKRLAMAGSSPKGIRPATMIGMVWGPEGPPSAPPRR